MFLFRDDICKCFVFDFFISNLVGFNETCKKSAVNKSFPNIVRVHFIRYLEWLDTMKLYDPQTDVDTPEFCFEAEKYPALYIKTAILGSGNHLLGICSFSISCFEFNTTYNVHKIFLSFFGNTKYEVSKISGLLKIDGFFLLEIY